MVMEVKNATGFQILNLDKIGFIKSLGVAGDFAIFPDMLKICICKFVNFSPVYENTASNFSRQKNISEVPS